MVPFLSVEWLDRLDAAMSDSGLSLSPGSLVIEQHITSDDDTAPEVDRYHVIIDAAGCRAVQGPAPQPDVTLVMSATTAARLSRGDENLQQALTSGRCRVGGHPERLARVGDSLRARAQPLDELRCDTEYPP